MTSERLRDVGGEAVARGCTVVLPTYNEREVVPETLRRVDDALAATGREYEVVVVDDDSPDGTVEAVRDASASRPVRALRRRGKRGLATAVVDGVERARHEVVVVMDADLQHPPERVPDLLAAVDDGADVAVGSRYVAGGSMDGLPPSRRVVSSVASTLARALVPHPAVRPLSDPMSGFFAFDRQLVDGCVLRPVGYKILLEVLVRGNPSRVVEVGYEFDSRAGAETSFRAATVGNYLRHLVRLRRAAAGARGRAR